MTTPPDTCPHCGAEVSFYSAARRRSIFACSTLRYGNGKITKRTPACYERQISALLNDKPTADEFERVCTSNHQLERELAQLRHESGIKDSRIAELEMMLIALPVKLYDGGKCGASVNVVWDGCSSRSRDVFALRLLIEEHMGYENGGLEPKPANTNACLLKEESK